MHFTLEEIADVLRSYVSERLPGVHPNEIRVPLSNGQEIVFPIGAVSRSSDRVPDDLAAAVVDAIADAGEPLQAAGLARKIGRPCNARLRAYLAAMVRDGLILSTSDGYDLPKT